MFRDEMKYLKEYVPGKPVEEVMKTYGLTDIVKLASNENPLGPSPLAIKSIQEQAKYVNLYPDGAATVLKAALSKKYDINADQILIGSGGEQIIKLVAQTFVNKGDEVIFADPSFGMYEIMSTHIGAKCISVPLTKEMKHDFDAFVKAVNKNTKVVYVCNPNNPTGNIMTKDELDKFISAIPNEVVVLLDEAYYEYAAFDERYPNGLEILKNRPNTVVLRTFSKVSGLAGLRIAYCFSSPKIISEMTKIKGVFNANKLAQHAATASLGDHEHLEETLSLNQQSKEMMIDYFDAKGMNCVPSHTNFIFVNIKHDSKVINELLLQKGIIIRPGFLWGYNEYIRVSTGSLEQTKKFIDALDDVLSLQA